MKKEIVRDMLKRFSAIVVWGLNGQTSSTQRHVHRHMVSTLKKLGCDVIWSDNIEENNKWVPNGSLVISSDECCSNIKYSKENWYALFHGVHHIPDCKNYVRMYLHGEVVYEKDAVVWNKTTLFYKPEHKLYQTWVSDLLPEEFQSPVFTNSTVVNWVGSIWNDHNNHGNTMTIDVLQKALVRHGLSFVHCKNISDEENIVKVRESRIAPSIGGDFQTIAMLPCRVWKNISYGQMGITNLSKSVDIFGDLVLFNKNIDELVESALSIPESEYKNRTVEQQKIVADGYTYLNFFYNIAKALEELGVQ